MTQQKFSIAQLPFPTLPSVDNADGAPSVVRYGERDLGFELFQYNEGRSAGVQVIRLFCDQTSVDLIPQRGLGIRRATCHGIRFGWDSPVPGPVHPQWVPLDEPSGLGWLEGFDEMVVRCGLSNNGAPEHDSAGRLKWPLHGRIANLPAQSIEVVIDQAARTIGVTGQVIEARFLFHRLCLETNLQLQGNPVDAPATNQAPTIQIRDRVINQSNRSASVQMLYHCNFGPPLLESGSRLVVDEKSIEPRDDRAAVGMDGWPECQAPSPDFSEQVYFLTLPPDGEGWATARLVNANDSLSAEVKYQTSTLPYFTFWKNTAGLDEGYVVGLEPGTNFPNQRSSEEQANRLIILPAGQCADFALDISLYVAP